MQYEPKSFLKRFNEMCLTELYHEKAYWEQKIAESTAWGASVGVAYDFLQQTESRIARLEDALSNSFWGS